MKGALIGAGFFAQFHAEAWMRKEGRHPCRPEGRLPSRPVSEYGATEMSPLHAVADPAPGRAQAFAQQHGIPRAYESVEAMLDTERPDFVDIVTRPDTHLELTQLAAVRGIHVICQKPMAPTMAESIAMCEACEAAGVRLLIHENWRWQPWYREAARHIGQGALGKLKHLSFDWRTGDGNGPEPYTAQPYFREMPRLIIYESLVHILDTFRFLAGELEITACETRRVNPVIAGDDWAEIQVRFENGATGFIHGDRHTGPVPSPVAMGSMIIEGERGTLRTTPDGFIELNGQRLDFTPTTQGYKGDSVLATQQHFIHCLQTGQPAESEGRAYLRTAQLVEDAYGAAASLPHGVAASLPPGRATSQSPSLTQPHTATEMSPLPMPPTLSKTEVFTSLPPVWPEDVKPRIREMLAAKPNHKLIVLDDDPTGTQTVHDVPVLTTWDTQDLERELNEPGHCFYVLTNSRSLVADEARTLMEGVATSLSQALKSRGDRDVAIPVTRSDSTLRGHYPLETDVLSERLGPFDATLIIPYFEAGGRYTIHDVHYVAEGDKLTPAAETPFAKDAVFGYTQSNLRDWVQEKTQGRVQAAGVASVSIETLRTGGPEAVCARLLSLAHGTTCIVNSAALRDMDVFALGLLMAEAKGRRYLLRSAAQIVAARLGLEQRPLLTRDDLGTDGAGGGLIIVGSYVPKTTEQLARFLGGATSQSHGGEASLPPGRATSLSPSIPPLGDCEVAPPCDKDVASPIPLHVPDLLDEHKRDQTLDAALAAIHQALRANQDVIVFTSRDLITGSDAAQNLRIGNSVSAALVELVQRLEVRPRYLIAKGGITSNDIASKGLGMKRGIVAGQLLPGIPVWRVGAETRFPGMPYIVFPGNVGGPDALLEAVAKLKNRGVPAAPTQPPPTP